MSLKIPLLTCLALLPLVGPAPAPSPSEPPVVHEGREVLSAEEEYLYEVSWSMFKLGTIRLKAYPDLHAEAFVDSYEGVPMVDLHSIFYTVMDSALFSLASRSLEKRGESWVGMEYRYDIPAKQLHLEETVQNDPASPPSRRSAKGTLSLPDAKFIDGLSIGFFPRRFVQANQTVTVPTVLYGKMGKTTFWFTRDVVEEEIDALDHPVRVVEVEGNTDVEGIFGMTGDFTGYFSDDAAGVPIKGKLKVLIGTVTVELVKWNRKGWTPPVP
jgi:hypothetical protein